MEEEKKIPLGDEELKQVAGGSLPGSYYWVDTARCVYCGACRDACPADAVRDSGEYYVILESCCMACGLCAEACPTAAIHLG